MIFPVSSIITFIALSVFFLQAPINNYHFIYYKSNNAANKVRLKHASIGKT
jgi:hypothetical protein